MLRIAKRAGTTIQNKVVYKITSLFRLQLKPLAPAPGYSKVLNANSVAVEVGSGVALPHLEPFCPARQLPNLSLLFWSKLRLRWNKPLYAKVE